MTTDILERFTEAELDPAGAKSFALNPPPRQAASLHTRSRVPSPRQMAFATAVAAVALVIGAVLLPGGDSDSTSPPVVNALMAASANAAEQPSFEGVQYTRTLTTFNTAPLPPSKRKHKYVPDPDLAFTLYARHTTETWIRPDGSGRIRITNLPSRFPTPADRRIAAAGPTPISALTRPRPIEKDKELSPAAMAPELTREDLPPTSALPTDPAELKATFQAEYTTDPSIVRDRRIFQLATDVLMNPTASPDLRSACYEVIAGLNDVALDDRVKDPMGRLTTSASFTVSGGNMTTLYFDPESSRVLAMTDGVEGADLFSSEVIEQAAEVSSLTER